MGLYLEDQRSGISGILEVVCSGGKRDKSKAKESLYW